MTAPRPHPRLVVFLLAPDFRTLGGFEGQLTSLATGLADAGHTVTVFIRDPIPAGHPYHLKMLQAGVRVSAPPAWMGRGPGKAVRQRLHRLLLLAASPLLCLGIFPTVVRSRSWRPVWRDAWTRLHAALGPVIDFDLLMWRMEARLDRARGATAPDLMDVQHSMLPQGIRYARRTGVPVIYTEYGAPTCDLESVWAGLRPVINDADFIIGRAHASLDGLKRLCGATGVGVVIPNAVTTTPTPADREEPPIENGQVVIAAIGRLSPEKGLHYLLDAMRQLHAAGVPVRLVLAGDGPLRAALTEQARAWNLSEQVTLIGGFDDIASVLRGAHIVAHPSLNDGRSVAVLEAMAWSRPVVATRVGGLPELVVDGETGLLVPPADATAMARALEALAADPIRRRGLGRAARERFEAGGFSQAAMVAATLTVYDQVIRGGRRAAPPAGR